MNRIVAVAALFTTASFLSCAQNNKKDYIVTIKTSYGDMVAVLYDGTPKHKENFIKLAKQGYFDSTLFHRVIPNFMIQGGDPASKKAPEGQPLGMGGPAYTIEAEFVPAYFHHKGALSAARLGDGANPKKASSGSQFYIVQGQVWKESDLKIDQSKLSMGLQQILAKPENKPLYDSLFQTYQSGDIKTYEAMVVKLAPRIEKETGVKVNKDIAPERVAAYTSVGGAPNLDDQYTVFGKIIKGLEVVDKIAAVERNQADRPNKDVRMFVTVEELSLKKIKKLYGYQYPQGKK
jgi:peptidyl-prolyl cis-trans isomerase B (cyclophilin B)